MFKNFSQWHWVIFVWLQLLGAYALYLWYLHRLEHHLKQDNHE